MEADPIEPHPVLRVSFQEPAQAQKPAEKLGDDGGEGGAAHAGVEQTDEGDVQHHVQHRTEDQVFEGILPVTHRLHHAAETVVEHQPQASGKEGTDIGGGELHHILGRAHGLKHPGGKEHAEDRHKHARRQAEGHIGVDGLFQLVKEDGKAVKDVVTEAIAKIGENISVRRFVRYESAEGLVYSYIHGGGKIGVLVDMKGGDAELGKDVAMQVAAANPQFLNRNEVPASELEHEKEILTEQARNEGKPENIIAKMVIGRINKYYKEVCLVDQEFIRDGDLTISKLLKSKNADVARFARFQLGEGIEKKKENFAEEVAAFVNK